MFGSGFLVASRGPQVCGGSSCSIHGSSSSSVSSGHLDSVVSAHVGLSLLHTHLPGILNRVPTVSLCLLLVAADEFQDYGGWTIPEFLAHADKQGVTYVRGDLIDRCAGRHMGRVTAGVASWLHVCGFTCGRSKQAVQKPWGALWRAVRHTSV